MLIWPQIKKIKALFLTIKNFKKQCSFILFIGIWMFKVWPFWCFHTYLTYRTKQVVTYTSKNLQGATFDMRTIKSVVKLNKFMWSALSLAAGSSRSYLQQDFDLKKKKDIRTIKSIVKFNKSMWSPLSLAAGSSRSYLQQDFDLKSRCR